MTEELVDSMVAWLILGMFRGLVMQEVFPLKVREVKDNFNELGDIESFTIITESGLGFTATVSFEGQVA